MANEQIIKLVTTRTSGDFNWVIERKIATNETSKEIEKASLSKKELKILEEAEEKQIVEAEKEYKAALAYIKDKISPYFMKVETDKIRVNDTYAKTYFVYSYPDYLEGNWLSPIINWDVKFDMSMYVYPIDNAYIQKYLKKRLVQLYSERSINQKNGLVDDPGLNAQIMDVEELRAKLTRGQEKYFHYGLYITVYGKNPEELNKIWKDLETMLNWRNVLEKPAYLRAEQAFISTGPFAKDELSVYRNISTWGLSTTFPFTSSTLSHDTWILYGINTHNNSLVIYDRFKSENANMCVFAKSGSWKSFAVKLEILRSLMMNTDVIVVDPENEYRALVDAIWGSYLDVSLNSKQRINPFDLPSKLKDQDAMPWDLLRTWVVDLLGLMNLMLWKLTAEEESIMEKAIIATYSLKWINFEDDSTEGKEMPVMKDLYEVLETYEGSKNMLIRMEKFTTWIFAGLFTEKTNVDLGDWLQVFSVRDLDDMLRPIAMYIILNHVWWKVRSEVKKRIMVVDEAWNIMQHEDSAKFLFGLVKRARKYGLWITTITQDIEDFLASPYGKPVVTNSSTQLLLKQSTASIDALWAIFKLTEQEKYILLNSGVGQGLFFWWTEHVWIQVVASYFEEQTVTTKFV